MKIIRDKVAYIQREDLVFMIHSGLLDYDFLKSIIEKMAIVQKISINNSNRFEFVKFTDPKDVEFLKGITFLVEYDELKDLSLEEMYSLGEEILRTRNEKAERFNRMSTTLREQNKRLIEEILNLDNKIRSLTSTIYFIKSSGKMPFGIRKFKASHVQKSPSGLKSYIIKPKRKTFGDGTNKNC